MASCLTLTLAPGLTLALTLTRSLYNGFLPNFGRVVPRVMIVFLVMEQPKLNPNTLTPLTPLTPTPTPNPDPDPYPNP